VAAGTPAGPATAMATATAAATSSDRSETHEPANPRGMSGVAVVIEQVHRPWYRRKRILIPLVLLIALVVVAVVPGGAYGLGVAAGTVVRLIRDALSTIF